MTAGSRTQPFSSRDSQTLFGVFLGYTEYFDTILFGLGPEEATLMDPQHRLLLLCAKDALELTRMYENVTHGVFVGIATHDYESLKRELTEHIGPYTVTSDALSIATGRLAFTYDMTGPAVSIDTACSSSLVAGHYGTTAVREHECGAAAICGINLLFHGKNTASFLQAGMLARDGRCKTFDAAADGYVRAEGCDVMILHSFYNANAVIILGTAVNQDGRSCSLTAPSGPSQCAVITDALMRGNAVGRDVVAIKTHGTGTSLGDPIEIGGALAALGDDFSPPLELHSPKSLIGHAECAAGISSLSGAVRHISNALVTQVEHLRCINTHVSSSLTNMSACDPKACIPRCCHPNPGAFSGLCGTSAFAFQGTNAHIVVSTALKRSVVLDASVQGTSHFDLQRRSVWPIPSRVIRHTPAFQVTSPNVASVDFKFEGHTLLDVQNCGTAFMPFVKLTDVAYSSLQCLTENNGGSVRQPACLLRIVRPIVVDATILGLTIRAEVNLSSECIENIQIRCMSHQTIHKQTCLKAVISKEHVQPSLPRMAFHCPCALRTIQCAGIKSSSIAKVQVLTESMNIPFVSFLASSTKDHSFLLSSAQFFSISTFDVGKSVTCVETVHTEPRSQWTTSRGSLAASLHGAVQAMTSAFKSSKRIHEKQQTSGKKRAHMDFKHLPSSYLIEWCIITPADISGTASNEEESKKIIWKPWSEYDASGRAVLRDVYSQAAFEAVPGFEIYVDDVICEAQQSAIMTDPNSSSDECSSLVVAAAIELFLVILREASMNDASGCVYAFITRGSRQRPTVAALSALARGLQLEHPNSYGGVIDYDDESKDLKKVRCMPSWRPRTLKEIRYYVSIDVKGVARAARLTHAPKLLDCSPALLNNSSSLFGPRCRVIGGTNGVGLALAHAAAASKQITSLVLVGRTGNIDIEDRHEIESKGVAVDVIAANVNDAATTSATLTDTTPGSLIWCAGATSNAPLATVSSADCWKVMAPKVAAANAMLLVHQNVNIVLISSVSSAWGHKGASHYAAGNAFIDALAERERSRQSLPTSRVIISVRFGPISGTRMISTRDELRLKRLGLGCISPKCLFPVIERLLVLSRTEVIVADLHQSAFASVHAASFGKEWDLLADLQEEQTNSQVPVASTAYTGAIKMLSSDVRNVPSMLLNGIRGFIGSTPSHDMPLMDAGVDSITAIEIVDWISEQIGVRLPQTTIFDHPTLNELTRYVIDQVKATLSECGDREK